MVMMIMLECLYTMESMVFEKILQVQHKSVPINFIADIIVSFL